MIAVTQLAIRAAQEESCAHTIHTAIFTNLTQDHLDYHGTMQAYWQAKRRLFQWPGLRCAVVNLDDATPTWNQLTDWTMWATYPDWHPTQDLIVFSTRPWDDLDTGPSNLYTIRPDGTGTRTVSGRFELPLVPCV